MSATLEAYRCPLQASDRPARVEMLVLCICSQVNMPEESWQRLATLLQQPLDWQFLLRVARRHRMLPLLHRHFQAHFPNTFPAALMQGMREACQEIAIRNLMLSSALIKLVTCFRQHGIDAIPYKGPILTELAYGDLALRHFDDLDILVRERDVDRAKDLILASGYQSCGYESLGRLFTENTCHLVFEHPQFDYVVELHWAVVHSYFPLALEKERLWQRLRQVPFGGISVLAHSPEDLLLLLCVHGSKHHWMRLSWITDVAELIRKNPGLTWTLLIAEAGRLRCKRMLLLGIWLAVEVLAAPVPGLVSNALDKDPAVARLGAEVWDGINQSEDISWAGFKNVSFTCRMRECMRDRVAYVVKRVFTPTEAEWTWQALPRPFHFLYSPLRAMRLSIEHGRVLVKLALRGNKK